MVKSMIVKQVLEIAIEKEIKAYDFYFNTSKKIESPSVKAMLLELAEKELNHRRLLKNVIHEGKYQRLGKDIPKESRGIAEFLAATELNENATAQEVMIFAIKEEEKAYNFYSNLKSHFAGTELEVLFNGLAEEEKGHKIMLEDDYEEQFLKEN